MPFKSRPYMIMNSEREGYHKVAHLVPRHLRKYQGPFVKNGKIYPWDGSEELPTDRVRYLEKNRVDGTETPFGFLEIR